jgi:hypothetical protein
LSKYRIFDFSATLLKTFFNKSHAKHVKYPGVKVSRYKEHGKGQFLPFYKEHFMLRMFTFLALALSIGAGTAFAQDGQKKKEEPSRHRPSVEEMFKNRDKDHNGTLSLEEFVGKAKDNPEQAKRLIERFKAMDTNKDGSLTLDEMRAYWQKQVQNRGPHQGSGRRPLQKTTWHKVKLVI